MKPYEASTAAAPPASAAAAFLLRAVVAAALLAVQAVGVGCGGGDGGGGGIISPPGIVAGFTPTSTPATADLVRVASGDASGDVVVVAVSIGGPTTSQDISSFAFDLVLGDPTVADYLENPGATAGDALVPSAGQDVEVLAAQIGGRVIVGVSKLPAAPGNGIAAGEAVVVRIPFRLLRRGQTTLRFENAAAQDSLGGATGIQFDASPATLTGS